MRHTLPQPRPRTIQRPRLLGALAEWQAVRLIQIAAPAGYGKTTIASLWLRSLDGLPPGERPTTAWITASAGIDADHWLRMWIEALESHLPALRDLANDDGEQKFASTQRIRTLCSEIAAADAPLILVVDDYHLIESPDAHAVTQHILDLAPPPLHLVLLSRIAPPLQLAQLILDDALLSFAKEDLQLDHEEFVAFARQYSLDQQPGVALAQLEALAAGWVTGLKLLSYAIRNNAVMPAADDALDHYFSSQVLATLPDALRSIIEAAAPLPYFSAELLAAAIQRPTNECAELLRQLAATDTFVTVYGTPDGNQISYRFHPLFQDFLRRRAPAPRTTDVQNRAAVWLLDHDDVDAALAILDDGRRTTDDGPQTTDDRPQTTDHRRPTTDDGEWPSSVVRRPSSTTLNLCSDSLLPPSSVLDALAAAMRRALLRFDLTSLRRWLNAVPPETIAAHAPLAVAVGWYAWISEMPDYAQQMAHFQRAIDAVAALPAGPHFDELRTEASVMQTMCSILLGDIDARRRHIEIAERTPHTADSLAAAYLHMLRALFIDNDAPVETRLQRLQTGADIYERIGFGHGIIELTLAQLLLKWRTCLFDGAQATAAHLQATIDRAGWRYSTYVHDIHYLRGEMYYLTGQLTDARIHFERAVEHSHASGVSSVFTYMAQVMLQLCDAAVSADGAHRIDADADARAWVEIVHGESVTQGMAAWPRLLRDFRAGKPEACLQTLELLQLSPADLSDNTLDRLRLAVLAGAIFGGRTDDVITTKLAEFRTFLESTHFDLMRVQVLALQALHAIQSRNAKAAQPFLRALLPEIERTGMVQLLLDIPPLRSASMPAARRLLTNRPHNAEDTAQIVAHEFGLTRQERRILADLADGCDPKQIAADYHLSVATVRVHIYRLYQKLQVHSREDAVRIAKGMGMGEGSREGRGKSKESE